MSDNRLPKQVFVWGYCNGNKNWYSDILPIFKIPDAELILKTILDFENFMKCDMKVAEQQLGNLKIHVWENKFAKKANVKILQRIQARKKSRNSMLL